MLTRKEAIAKLTAIEEKHKQDGYSFWIHNVKGNEPWLLEIRQGLLRKEKLKNKEYLLPKDLTKETLISEIKNFQAKSNIRRKYHFKKYCNLNNLFKKYDLNGLYLDYQQKRQLLVFEDTKTGQTRVLSQLEFACKVKSKIKAREIVKDGVYENCKVTKYPQWIRKKRKEHETVKMLSK